MTILIGTMVRDTVTGLTGKVIGRTEWLVGPITIGIQPTTLFEGRPIDPFWIYEPRAELV